MCTICLYMCIYISIYIYLFIYFIIFSHSPFRKRFLQCWSGELAGGQITSLLASRDTHMLSSTCHSWKRLRFADCAKAPNGRKVNPTHGHKNNHQVAHLKAQWQKQRREKKISENGNQPLFQRSFFKNGPSAKWCVFKSRWSPLYSALIWIV